ncbi:sulfatase-like hydrolase/transferase [Helicobacter sp. 23-1044]
MRFLRDILFSTKTQYDKEFAESNTKNTPPQTPPTRGGAFSISPSQMRAGDKGGGLIPNPTLVSANPYPQIAIFATLCIALLICVFNPYALYNSDITQFDSTQTKATLGALFGAFLLASFSAIYALSFIPQKWQKIPAFALSVALFIGIAYSFIFTGDYGAMDHFVFQRTPFDDKNALVSAAREFVLVLCGGALFVAFALKYLLFVWKIIFVTLIVVSGVNAVQIAKKRIDSANFAESKIKSTHPLTPSAREGESLDFANQINFAESNTSTPPQIVNNANLPYAESPLFSYSKTDKNIVVIVLDMFSGSHTPFIFEQFPHLKSELDGWTLYPNAISSGNATMQTMATLIGGEHYAVYNMNKRAQNLANEIEKAFMSTTQTFANNGFQVALNAYTGSDIGNLAKNGIFAIDSASEIFVDYLGENLGIKERIYRAKSINNRNTIGQLFAFGLFKFAPKQLRGSIYNDGNWIFSADWYLAKILANIRHTADFYAFTQNLRVDSAKPTFKFIHSMITHLPFGMHFKDGKCEFGGKWSAWSAFNHGVKMNYPNFNRMLNFYQHYDTEACALHYLRDFVKNLKNAGIYDNTQILVVSDHGGNDGINLPILDKNDWRPDVLFLFKDFGARGELKVDKRLMANFDVASIFCANLKGGCPNVPPNILQNYPQNRELLHTLPISWRLQEHSIDKWHIRKAFKVRDNIFDAQNWVEIDEFVNMKE